MSIIAKHILKNIIAKPFRSIILFVCISVCAFVGLLSFDILGNMELIVKNLSSQIMGSSDITFLSESGMTEELEISANCNQLLVYSRNDGTVNRIDGVYNYFHKENFTVNYVDYEMAYKMALISDNLDLAKEEVAITKRLMDRNSLKVGDSISLVDDNGNKHSFVIVKVLSELGLGNGCYSVFVSREGYETLTNNMRATSGYIDVINDDEAKEVNNEIKSKYYNVTSTLLMDSEENKEILKELGIMMGLIFVVCLLLVVFVAISLSSRIVCERMSVIGTLRSLGLSSAFTTKLLLLENAMYGLIGSLMGSGLYLLARGGLFDSIFAAEGSGVTITVDYGHINPSALILVCVISMLIMCACPLKEILKTAKIAIRDIIFDNKDTAYKYNKKTFVAGVLVMALAAFTFFFKNNIAMQFICFSSIIISVAILFPWILRAVAKALANVFARTNHPIAQLSANEAFSRKSTVGSSVLGVTISVLAIILFIFVATTGSIYDLDTYSADVIATINSGEKPEQYKYVDNIEGVVETEFVYNTTDKLVFGEEKKEVNIFGLNDNGFKYFVALKKCPESLEKDEMVIDSSLAKKLGFKVGDVVNMVFGEDGFMPITKELKLVGVINSYDFDSTSNSVVISKDLYIDIYHNYPGMLLVKCDETANIESVVSTLNKYSATSLEEVKTNQEMKMYWMEKGDGMEKLLLVIIILGVSLSIIGMVSNQLIGFEGRKRECAVLASVAMGRASIAKMLLIESCIATASSLLVALPLALLAFIPFRNIILQLSGAFKVNYNVGSYAIFLCILFIVFSGVTLFPVKELKKMKIANQLKYE